MARMRAGDGNTWRDGKLSFVCGGCWFGAVLWTLLFVTAILRRRRMGGVSVMCSESGGHRSAQPALRRWVRMADDRLYTIA